MATLIEHPLVQHKLALIRDAGTGHKRFRELAKEITQFLCYEALKNIRTKEVVVETPVNLTSEQRELLEKLEESMGTGKDAARYRPKEQGFFDGVKNFFDSLK